MADSTLVPLQGTVPAKADAATEVALAPDPALVSRIRGEIHLNDRAQLISFGDQAQRDVASYADQILRSTVNRDSGSVGNLLTNLLTSVNKLDPESLRKASFFEQLFGGLKAKLFKFKEQFQTLASQVDRIAFDLERQQDTMRRDRRPLRQQPRSPAPARGLYRGGDRARRRGEAHQRARARTAPGRRR